MDKVDEPEKIITIIRSIISLACALSATLLTFVYLFPVLRGPNWTERDLWLAGIRTTIALTITNYLSGANILARHNSTGVPMTTVTCRGCGVIVNRKLSEVRRGQNKFCSRLCSNRHRERINGKYTRGHTIL